MTERSKACAKQAAIILMTAQDDVCQKGEAIMMDLGLTSTTQSDFKVNNRGGTTITFLKRGLYSIVLEGCIGVSSEASISAHARSLITISLVRTPALNSNELPFGTHRVSPGDFSRSTLLSFGSGDTLHVSLSTPNGRPVAVSQGTRLVIVRVGDR